MFFSPSGTTPSQTESGARPGYRRVVTAIALAAALTVPALAASSAQAAPVRSAADPADTVLKVATSADIDTLNPFTAILASSTGILRLQYESLTAYSAKDNSIVPGIASKWSTSKDGKTWTFTIPKGRVWSDGKPQTADDVAWTFEAIKKDPELQQANGGLLESVKSVTAPDKQTVQITLAEAQASNPGAELPIVPEHIWKGIKDPANFANDKNSVGSGPFTIESYTEGQSVILKANKRFWRGAPKISGISYVYYKNTDAQVQALKTGEVDIIPANNLVAAQYNSLKGQEGITVNPGVGRRYTSLNMNSGALDSTGAPLGDGNPVLKDVRVRTAIQEAIDNKTLFTKVLQGLGVQGQTEEPPVYPEYFGIDKKDVIPFDPKAANAQLDKAGYPKGADGIRTDKSGKPISLRLLGRSTDPTHAQMAEYIKPWLKEIGIDVTVTLESSNQVNDDSTLGKYDMYFTGFGIGPDPDFQLSINTCASRPNADGSGALSESNWCSPEFDKLYKAQHTELDPDKRAAIVKQAFGLIYKAAVNDVIWYASPLEAYRSDRFTGFEKQPAKNGVISAQNGYWGFYSATPVGTKSSGSTDASAATSAAFPAWATVLIVVVVVLILGLIVLLVVRRRRVTSDDRE